MKSLINALKTIANRLSVSERIQLRQRSQRTRRRRSQDTLSFETLQPRQLLATVAMTDGDWFDPTIWSDGVPDVSMRAIIGHGVTVELDGAVHEAEELVIHGDLVVTEDATEKDKTLTSRWIHINSDGVFQVGSEANRYDEGTFTIKLTGTDVESDHVIETNMGGTNSGTMNVMNNDGFLMTAMGGRVQFFGEDKLSFTKLSATAAAGDTTIIVENLIERNYDQGAVDGNGEFVTSAADDGEVNWKEGDQIVIASSSYDYTEEDVRTIMTIENNGDTSTLTLDSPLSHRHYGEIETYGENPEPGTTAASQTYKIDLRAEVALLSRNIVIEGLAEQDTDNEFGDRANAEFEPRVRADGLSDAEAAAAPAQQVANGVGGHLMFMKSSGQITVDGVQLEGLGQSSQKGRYPIHWHLGDNKTGDVLRNSSVTNSNNRGVTIHGTSNLRVEGVVLHDVHGHGFFFEDAVETDNVLVANIAIGIHKVGGNDKNFANPGGTDQFIVDTHDSVLETGSRFESSAAFWITNPDNTFVGNIAAGGAGTGFWYALPRTALGASGQKAAYADTTPIFAEFGQFDNNTSHSTPVGLNFDRGSDIEDARLDTDPIEFDSTNNYSPRTGSSEDGDRTSHTIFDFTNYKSTDAAFYHRGDAETILLDGLKVADSFNGPWAVSENLYDNSLFVGHSRGNGDTSQDVGGPRLYDGAGLYTNTHFAGFGGENAYAFQVEGSSFGPTMYHAFRETSFEADGTYSNMSHAVSDFTANENGHNLGQPAQWIKAVIDLDGTLTGAAAGSSGFSIVPNVDFLVDGDDIQPAGWDAWLTDDIYARIRVENNNDGEVLFPSEDTDGPFIRFTARDGDSVDVTSGQNNGDRSWTQIAAKTDGDGTVEGTFTVEFLSQGVPTNGFVLNMDNQDGGRPELDAAIQAKVDAARIVVRIVAAGNYTPDNSTEVFSEAALRSATSDSVFFRGDAGDLYLNTAINNSQPRIALTPGDPLQTTFNPRTVEYGTTIQAEEFDNGIDGIAYHDTDATNSFGSFRNDTGVDATPTKVGDIADGEWLEYTSDIVANDVASFYRVGVNVSSTAASGQIRIMAASSNSAGFLKEIGTIDVPDTGGVFDTLWLEGAADLASVAGTDSVIRLEFVGGGFEVDSVQFAAPTQTAHVDRTIAAASTTRIELEEFDEGGQNVAYFDKTAGNNASTTFRANEDVDTNGDILTNDVENGEWLEYTTDIEAGIYDITLGVNWTSDNKGVKVSIGESSSATEFTELGQFVFGVEEGDEVLTLKSRDLSAWAGSERVIRIEIVGDFMGINWLDFVPATGVQQRGIYYGNSTFSNGGVGTAIAPNKTALMPGEIATFENYTSSLAGINGLVIDINSDDSANISADDFVFRFGNVDDVSAWATITPAVTVTVDAGAGINGTDRIVLEFPDGEIVNGWLQTTVLANADTGLSEDDVFYFGNAIGESGNSTTDATVNLLDVALARSNQTGFSSADIDNQFDFDRDGRVNLIDVAIARSNQSGFTPIRLINLSSNNRFGNDGSGKDSGASASSDNFMSQKSELSFESCMRTQTNVEIQTNFQPQPNVAPQELQQNRDRQSERLNVSAESETLTLSGQGSSQPTDANFDDDRSIEFDKPEKHDALDQAFTQSLSVDGLNDFAQDF